MKSFFRKLTWLVRRPIREADLQEELQFHLEEEAESQIARGRSAADARLAARRELGNLTRVQEETRAAWSWTLVEHLRQDIRYTLRTMAANKAFSALAVLSLALGIGANTAIFSFMDAILLRSLPAAHPESLVTLSWRTNENEFHGLNFHDDSFLGPKEGFGESVLSYPAMQMFAGNDAIFSSVFGYQSAGDLHLRVGNQAQIANTEYVTGNYFQSLGIPSAAGRLIMADDDRAGAPAVAVVSFALSQRRFGSPTGAVNQSILISNLPFTVVGVAPPEFFGADPGAFPDLYIPIHAELLLNRDGSHTAGVWFTDPDIEWVIGMARLQPGVSIAQAQVALRPQFSEWMRTVNKARNRADLPRLVLRDGSGGLSGMRLRYSKPLMILLTLVALILALACANIANLLLARATARRLEIAVRLSIGAGRARVIRQLLTESVMLAAIGGLLGIAFAVWGIRFLTLLLSAGSQNFTLHAEVNWHVLAVVAALSMVTGILFGLAPALQSTRVDLMPALKESHTAATRGARRLTLSRALMVTQLAISLVILVAAGLFVRTLSNLESIDLGFNRENVLTFKLNARQAGHIDPEIGGFYSHLQEQFAAIPGVRSASFSDIALVGGRMMTGVSVNGAEPKTALMVSVGSGFFTTMEAPILLGREIQPHDPTSSHLVAVVNQVFAQKNFGERNPLGQILTAPDGCATCAFEIVGVSSNALVGNEVRDKARPTVFVPYTANLWGSMQGMIYELRTAGNPLGYARTVRELIRQADPRLPVSEIQTQSALIDATINREVVFARLCTAFALLALVTACVGLYGAMSYNVARRTGEIGIRMALGAARSRVVWMVLREVLLLVAAGLVISIPAALFGTKLLKSFLYETQPNDPISLTVAAVSLVVAATLAGYLPARKASRIDPMVALRNE
jgi:macrolide transport system ATP-binding/permease protein